MKIGVFSDVHGVVGAFEKTRDQLIYGGAEKLIYLGDVVGYVPHMGALKSLMTANITALRGNHEAMLIMDNIPANKDDIYQLTYFKNKITENERDYINALPENYEEIIEGVRCFFVHGSPDNNISGYVYPDTNLKQFDLFMKKYDVAFMGNTHHPFVRECNGKVYINVGSCGLPRGGAKHGSACIFDTHTMQANLIEINLRVSSIQTLSQTNPADAVVKILNILQG